MSSSRPDRARHAGSQSFGSPTPLERTYRALDRGFRVFGAPALTGYLLVGALAGLGQQSTDLPDASVDCAYRAVLIEDRIRALASFGRAHPSEPRFSPRSSSTDSLTPLIKHTIAACTRKSSPVTPKLLRLQDAFSRWQGAHAHTRDL